MTSFKGRPVEIDPGFTFDVIRYEIRKLNTFDSYLELLHSLKLTDFLGQSDFWQKYDRIKQI